MHEDLLHQLIEVCSIVTLPFALLGMAYAITLMRRMDRYVRTQLPTIDDERRS